MMRVSLKHYTIAIIGFLLVLIFLQAAIAVASMYLLDLTAERLAQERMPAVRSLGEIDAQTTRSRLRATRYLLAIAPAEKARIEEQIAQSEVILQQEFARYDERSSGDEERHLWGAFKADWQLYEARQKLALAESRAGDLVAARSILETSRDEFNQMTKELQGLIALHHRLGADDIATASNRYWQGLGMLIGFAALAIALILGLGIVFIRRITNPVVALTSAMRSVADGNLKRDIPGMHALSEISEMAAALVVLRDNLSQAEQHRLEQAEMDMANLRLMNEAQLALNDYASALDQQVIEKTQFLAEREREIVWRLSRATERRDNDTGDHIARMSRISGLVAEAMGLPKEDCRAIEIAAQMHDIGKVGIPDAILFKTGTFTPEERKIMETHVILGWEVLKGSESQLIQTAAEIALSHHERWDGQGYPHGLAGDSIPLSGRIAAIADVFDALTSIRPYKRAWSVEEAITFIEDNAGKHFDPDCVEAFMLRIDEIVAITGASAGHLASTAQVA